MIKNRMRQFRYLRTFKDNLFVRCFELKSDTAAGL